MVKLNENVYDERVLKVQQFLINAGHLAPTYKGDSGQVFSSADGGYGAATEQAIRRAGFKNFDAAFKAANKSSRGGGKEVMPVEERGRGSGSGKDVVPTQKGDGKDVVELEQPQKPGLLQKIFGRRERVEESVAIGVAASQHCETDVRVTGSASRRKTTEEFREDGSRSTKDGRTTLDAPGMRSSYNPRLTNTDNHAELAAGSLSGKHQKNFRAQAESRQDGNVISTNVKGGNLPLSSRGNGYKYDLSTQTTVTNGADGVRHETQGQGGLGRLFGKKKDVNVEGQNYRAHDQAGMGVVAHDRFVITNAQTGQRMFVSEASVARAEKNGKTVTEFIHEQTKGEKGRRQEYYLERVTENPKKPGHYSFQVIDKGQNGWYRAEAGWGKVEINRDGDVKDSRKGGRLIAAADAKTVSVAGNAGVFAGSVTTDVQVAQGKNGKATLVAGDSKEREFSVGVGAKIGLDGAGPFVYAVGQLGREKTKSAIDTHLGKNADGVVYGEQVARLQIALRDAGYYNGKIDGQASVDHKNGKYGETAQAIVRFYADNPDKWNTRSPESKLASLVRHVDKNNPEVAAIRPGYNEYFSSRTSDAQTYAATRSCAVTINGNSFSAEEVQKVVNKTVSKLGDVMPDVPGKQVPNMTLALYTDSKGRLQCADPRESGTWSKEVGGATFVTYSINGVSLDPAQGHGVKLSTSTVDKSGRQSNEETVTVTSRPRQNPVNLVNPGIPERCDKPKKGNPSVDPKDPPPNNPPPNNPPPSKPYCPPASVDPRLPIPTTPTTPSVNPVIPGPLANIDVKSLPGMDGIQLKDAAPAQLVADARTQEAKAAAEKGNNIA